MKTSVIILICAILYACANHQGNQSLASPSLPGERVLDEKKSHEADVIAKPDTTKETTRKFAEPIKGRVKFGSGFEQSWIAAFEGKLSDEEIVFHRDLALYQSLSGKVIVRDASTGKRYTVCDSVGICDHSALVLRLQSIQTQLDLLALFPSKNDQGKMTIEFEPLPAAEQFGTCFSREFRPGLPGEIQYLPLCWSKDKKAFDPYFFQVKVTHQKPEMVTVGFYLASNGCIAGIQAEHRQEQNGSVVAHYQSGSALPANTSEYVIFFAVDRANELVRRLTVDEFDSCKPQKKESLQALSRLISEQPTPITGASREIQTVVNPLFHRTTGEELVGIQDQREYTIEEFDIRPYLPDDTGSSLYRILYIAHQLTGKAKSDGIGYKQHAWRKATDEENLALGIDCSRAVWFSFTRAKQPYTKNTGDIIEYNEQEYLHTGAMVSESSLLANNFQRCDNEQLQIGDVLVYRREDADEGHVVLVIDPEHRIAWGSHGWDGNGRTPEGVPDVGAEYQLIKYKRDWQAWDRSTMTLRACWRHNSFVNLDKIDIGNAAIHQCDIDLSGCRPEL